MTDSPGKDVLRAEEHHTPQRNICNEHTNTKGSTDTAASINIKQSAIATVILKQVE